MKPMVDASGRFFRLADGSPFFYLADTVWMLFNKLTEDEIRRLFADRAAKGFTVIHAVVFRDMFEPNTPNVEGVRPFASDDDMRAAEMNPAWIDFVARITRVAGEYGLVMGLLPTWGDKWNEHSNSAGPVVMDAEKGRRYCRRLSDALGECDNVVWILGGDSPLTTQAHCDTVRAMAEGVRDGACGEALISFHPTGGRTSAVFHGEPWLDFHAAQSGHAPLDNRNYRMIEDLYGLHPAKPCLDMESNFEWMPDGIRAQDGMDPEHRAYTTDWDVRRSLYRSVLSGAAGFGYGCEPVRQVYRTGDRSHAWDGKGIATWDAALAAPGSFQLRILKDALLERSYFTRAPAQELLLRVAGGDNSDAVGHVVAARCIEGRYVMLYIPVRRSLRVDTSAVEASRIRVTQYDPESGDCIASWEADNDGELHLRPLRLLDTFVVVDAVDGT